MTLEFLLNTLCELGIHHNLVNYAAAGGSIYALNAETIKDYPFFFISPTEDILVEKSTTTYGLTIFYCDRLLQDSSNDTQVFSNGTLSLTNFIRQIRGLDGIVSVDDFNIRPFTETERLNDRLGGAYTRVRIKTLNSYNCSIIFDETGAPMGTYVPEVLKDTSVLNALASKAWVVEYVAQQESDDVTEEQVKALIASALTKYTKTEDFATINGGSITGNEVYRLVEQSAFNAFLSGYTDELEAIYRNIGQLSGNTDEQIRAIMQLLTGISAEFQVIDGQISGLSEDIQAVSGATADNTQYIAALSAATQGLSTDISNVSGATAGILYDISGISADVRALSGATEGLIADISGVSEDIAALSGATEGVIAAMTGFSEDIQAVSGATMQNAQDISDISGATTANTQSIETLSGATTANTQDIAALSAVTVANVQDIEALSGATTANTQGIQTLSAATVDNAQGIEAISGATSANTQDIATLSGVTAGKQDALTAGTNITISGSTISAAGNVSSATVYTIWSGTAQEYDLIDPKDPNTLYIVL